MGEITIDLTEPLDLGGGAAARRVRLREPKAREYLKIGEPILYQRLPDGAVAQIDNDAAIAAYVQALVIEPDIPALIGNLSLADSIRVKDALLDFFRASQVRARSPGENS